MNRVSKEVLSRISHGKFKPLHALRFPPPFLPLPPQDTAVILPFSTPPHFCKKKSFWGCLFVENAVLFPARGRFVQKSGANPDAPYFFTPNAKNRPLLQEEQGTAFFINRLSAMRCSPEGSTQRTLLTVGVFPIGGDVKVEFPSIFPDQHIVVATILCEKALTGGGCSAKFAVEGILLSNGGRSLFPKHDCLFERRAVTAANRGVPASQFLYCHQPWGGLRCRAGAKSSPPPQQDTAVIFSLPVELPFSRHILTYSYADGATTRHLLYLNSVKALSLYSSSATVEA